MTDQPTPSRSRRFRVIQGGMGAGVSHWGLANAVARAGQLGIVSGTGIDTLFIRRLQDGDPGGHMRRAMSHFPVQRVSEDALTRWYQPGGRPEGTAYRVMPLFSTRPSPARDALIVLAAFVEVFLAREGHDGTVGVNLLTKIQPPTLPCLYGAMLAGVEYVTMGAGIPREIPGALDKLALHQSASIRYEVTGGGDPPLLTFDPMTLWETTPPPLVRPQFLAIISSNLLANVLARKASGKVDGFIVEGPTAGGHNAPPRGPAHFNERGEPLYGERDVVDLAALREIGVPFWIAGGAGSPQKLREALAAGASGIQVGTLFAFCQESGLREEYRAAVLAGVRNSAVDVVTDPLASPTGYPFKVVQVEGLPTADGERVRICELGYLRTAYRKPDGSIGHRCPAEPVGTYVAKGGEESETVGRQCLCNALMTNVGLGQVREDGYAEPPLLTSGDDLISMGTFLAGREHYSAQDVLDYLLADPA